MLNTKYILSFLMVAASLMLATRSSAQFPKFLIPKSVVSQYAGSIGFVSVGAGYELFKNDRGSLDFNYGYIPKNKGGVLHILAAKFAYRPIEIKVNKWAKLYPVNPGAFISYHFGPQFDTQWDKDTYEKGYYWWSTAVRPHISIGTELKLDAKKILPSLGVKALRVYSEFNTNELYLISYYQNVGSLSITDIFKLGFGVRVDF
ncbi:hypothetical protein [Arcticibacter svalbardensis]|nr:hypothetical protein [Arcticibacter svalbardensis]